MQAGANEYGRGLTNRCWLLGLTHRGGARIGLFNIIPRAYSCRETYHRIDVFNSLLSGHVANIIPNVYWIRLYWEFVDKSGYLRHEFYGRNGVHLNFRGKGFMARTISNFQRSYF